MIPSALLLVFLSIAGPFEFGVGESFHKVGAAFSNSPGLSCRTITVASVYEKPSLSAKILGRMQNFIAVTGVEVNGFVPMIAGRKIRGWVEALETTTGKPTDLRGPCVVQMQPDGRLLFGWP